MSLDHIYNSALDLFCLGSPETPLYLIKEGPSNVLVEGGVTRDLALVSYQLETLDIKKDSITHWFITHAHYDHCGLLEYLYPQFPNVTVFASEKAISNFRNNKYTSKIRSLNALISSIEIAPPMVSFKDIPYTCLKDEDQIYINQKQWKVLETPGHSACSLSIYHEESQLVFVSDALGEYLGPGKWAPLAFSDIGQFINSIHRIDGLPKKMMALGHHGVLTEEAALWATKDSLQCCYDAIKWVQEKMDTLSGQDKVQQLCKRYKTGNQSYIPEFVFSKSMVQLIERMHSFQRE